jgi:integrase
MGRENAFEFRYLNRKKSFLSDKSICAENRKLFKKFLEHEEYKLRRKNGLSKLDESSYQTVYYYIIRFNNINKWFRNKPLTKITKKDIKRVYDALEEGKILTQSGKPFMDRASYYSKVFKSKFFEMIGKDGLAREVIEYPAPNNVTVRFVVEEDIRTLVDIANKPLHRLLIWLAFDIGENINALLKLKKSDFLRQINPDTNEPEYRINLDKSILKRTRRPRSELTNYNETTKLLDVLLAELEPGEAIFKFDYANAKKILDRHLAKTHIKTQPKGDKPTWKDLRSGMACDLLKKGWTTDEVNARLGHKPSSAEIDKYVSFLALDRHRPKKKVAVFQLEKIADELEDAKRREKLYQKRMEDMQEQILKMKRKDFKTERLVKVLNNKLNDSVLFDDD